MQASLKREFYRLLPALRTTRELLGDEKKTADKLSKKWSRVKTFASPIYRAEGRLSELAKSPAYEDPNVARLVDKRVEEEALCTMALLMCEKALSKERELPLDVLFEIFQYLEEETVSTAHGSGVSMLPALISASQVSSRWRDVALHRSLWRKVHVVCDSFSTPGLAVKMVEAFYTNRSMDNISLIISDTDRWNDDNEQKRSYYLAQDITLPRATITAFLRSLATRPEVCARISSLSLRLCKHFEPIPPFLGYSNFAASLVNLEAFVTSRQNVDDLSRGMENQLKRFLEHLANPAEGSGEADAGAFSRMRTRLKSLRLDHALLSPSEVRQILSIHTRLEDVSLTVGDPILYGNQQSYPDMAYDEALRSLRFTFSQESECGVDDILMGACVTLPEGTSVIQIGGKEMEREREREKPNRTVSPSPTGARQARYHRYGCPRAPRRND